RLRTATVVTAQRAVAVQRQRDVAVTATTGLATRTTVDRRRHAAPVQQENRPAAALRDAAELPEQRGRQRIAGFTAQVDDLYRRQRGRDPAAELEPLQRLPRIRASRRRAERRDRAIE